MTDYPSLRRDMIEKQLRLRGIRDSRVLAAMGELPRELFVPRDRRAEAYFDGPLLIGFNQTISQPYITALMVETLKLQGRERVLDVGSGSGYHAAILGALAHRVVSIEIVPALADLARDNLARAGRLANISVLNSDGSLGYPPDAPFDAISVAAGAPEVPSALLNQLGEPGVLVIPIGNRDDQDLRVFTKSGGRIDSRIVSSCRFVPLLGEPGLAALDFL